MIFEDDILIPQQVDDLRINIIIKYFSDLYIDTLLTLWYRQWGIKYVKWGKIMCVD